MMYFLVSMPPKTLCSLNPDFAATSVKFAIGVEDADFACCAFPATATKTHAIVSERREREADGMDAFDVRCANEEGQAGSMARDWRVCDSYVLICSAIVEPVSIALLYHSFDEHNIWNLSNFLPLLFGGE